MSKPTLLYVEETSNTLSRSVISNKTIQLVLLRFKQNMFFDKSYLKKTSQIPCFILNKEADLKNELVRFKNFSRENNIKIDYFYNDSEYNQEAVQQFARALRIPGFLKKRQAVSVRDKVAMKKILQKVGFKTMPYKKLSSVDNFDKFIKKHGGLPAIVKWKKGLSSKEVYKIDNTEQLKGLKLDYSTGRYIAEKYCPHLIWCIDSLVQNGKVVTVFYAWLPYTNLSFAEKKEKFAQITVNKKPIEFKFDGKKITQRIISNLGLKNGYMHLEAFVDSFGKPTVCEFAWRTPGEHMLSNHSIAFGLDVCSTLTDLMVGRKINLTKFKGKKCVGDMFLPIKEGVVSKISSYNDLKNLDGVIDGEVFYKKGDNIESKRQYTSCSGWIQITGKTKDEVLQRMLKVYGQFKLIIK